MDNDKHSDWLMNNDIIMMGSNWLIDNDMHMKKHSDWLAYMGAIGIITMGSKVGVALNRCPQAVTPLLLSP